VTFAKVVCAQTATGIDMMLNAVREPYAGKLARTVLRGRVSGRGRGYSLTRRERRSATFSTASFGRSR
jgi:hypothetical protein